MASNLVWLAIALGILCLTYRSVRRGKTRLGMVSAMTLAMLIGLILLPVISISDDLIEAKQAALPLSAQTWRLASEGASVGVDILPITGVLLLSLMCFRIFEAPAPVSQWEVSPLTAWLTRSLRLRPPPATAL